MTSSGRTAFCVVQLTLDYAETHFPQILRQVLGGEEVVLCRGTLAVARLVPVAGTPALQRPSVGEITSAPVRWNEASFAPLDDEGMKDLGLL